MLAVERIGVHDDFFELGGDSLSVVELLAGLGEELDLELSASDLLRHATGRRGRDAGRRPIVTPSAIGHRGERRHRAADSSASRAPPTRPIQYRPLGRPARRRRRCIRSRTAASSTTQSPTSGRRDRPPERAPLRAVDRRRVRTASSATRSAARRARDGEPAHRRRGDVELVVLLEPSLGQGWAPRARRRPSCERTTHTGTRRDREQRGAAPRPHAGAPQRGRRPSRHRRRRGRRTPRIHGPFRRPVRASAGIHRERRASCPDAVSHNTRCSSPSTPGSGGAPTQRYRGCTVVLASPTTSRIRERRARPDRGVGVGGWTAARHRGCGPAPRPAPRTQRGRGCARALDLLLAP